MEAKNLEFNQSKTNVHGILPSSWFLSLRNINRKKNSTSTGSRIVLLVNASAKERVSRHQASVSLPNDSHSLLSLEYKKNHYGANWTSEDSCYSFERRRFSIHPSSMLVPLWILHLLSWKPSSLCFKISYDFRHSGEWNGWSITNLQLCIRE